RIVSPTSFLSQPAAGGYPGGLVFAASVSYNGPVTITTATVDRLATDPVTCADYGYLPRSDFNWNFWTGSDISDTLWTGYPYGELAWSPETFAPFGLVLPELAFGSSPFGRMPQGTLKPEGTLQPAARSSGHRSRESALPAVMSMLPDPGA